MFYVQNADNIDCFKTEDFDKAKDVALKMKDELAENFNIVEVKQVWTTSTQWKMTLEQFEELMCIHVENKIAVKDMIWAYYFAAFRNDSKADAKTTEHISLLRKALVQI